MTNQSPQEAKPSFESIIQRVLPHRYPFLLVDRVTGFTPGVELRGKYTFFAEGARGSLTKQLTAKFGLRDGGRFQKYGIGLKELWRVEPSRHAGRNDPIQASGDVTRGLCTTAAAPRRRCPLE